MKKHSKDNKLSFSKAYKDIKGFGTLPESDKKKVRMSKFMEVLKAKK